MGHRVNKMLGGCLLLTNETRVRITDPDEDLAWRIVAYMDATGAISSTVYSLDELLEEIRELIEEPEHE